MGELSADVLGGLQIIGNSAQIPDNYIKTFIEKAIASILDPENKDPVSDPLLAKLDKGVTKQGHYALVTLILEAAKHDGDAASFSHILEDCKFAQERIQLSSDLYTKAKPQLRIQLSCTGNNPPHIVDVDWRLDYHVKSNNLEQKDVQFACSQDQLQDLVGKLKDACKSLERA